MLPRKGRRFWDVEASHLYSPLGAMDKFEICTVLTRWHLTFGELDPCSSRFIFIRQFIAPWASGSIWMMNTEKKDISVVGGNNVNGGEGMLLSKPKVKTER